VVWAPRLHGEPGGPTSITGTARFVPATFYIASLPFQDTPPNGGSRAPYLRPAVTIRDMGRGTAMRRPEPPR